MKSLYDKIIDEFNKEKKYKFIGCYSNYVTSLRGDDVISAIRYFNNHYNATLSLILEFDLNTLEPIQLYKSKLNKLPDVRGRFNYSYYKNSNNELVFNEDDDTKPILKLLPSKINSKSHHGYIDRNGNFYECNYQCHSYLADELFLSKTIPEPTKNEEDLYRSNESILDGRGWVKVSSKRIHYLEFINGNWRKLTSQQIETIIKYMDIIGDDSYEFSYSFKTKEEIINELINNK